MTKEAEVNDCRMPGRCPDLVARRGPQAWRDTPPEHGYILAHFTLTTGKKVKKLIDLNCKQRGKLFAHAPFYKSEMSKINMCKATSWIDISGTTVSLFYTVSAIESAPSRKNMRFFVFAADLANITVYCWNFAGSCSDIRCIEKKFFNLL